ncbi:MAG: hypothetical protein L0191_05140, partial [Acidobacteria bacterium]|nr:hypothetical protein [Acidobacteriota bacterium]
MSKDRAAFCLLILLVGLFFLPLLGERAVIYRHDNALELMAEPTGQPRLSRREFSDHSSFYLPELHHHLNGDRKAWISTWNPHVQLGRPSYQVWGLGLAYPLTRLLSWFTNNAYVTYTLQVVITTAVFAFLLFQALRLHPWACYASACGLALGIPSIYHLTFGLYLAPRCWILALLWLLARYTEKPTLARGLGISFTVYALLLSGYLQLIVWGFYLCLAFLVWRLWKKSWSQRLKVLLGLFASGVLGLLAAAPVYADLYITYLRSERLHHGVDFFLSVLPSVGDPAALLRFFIQVLDPFWFKNPIESEEPVRSIGLALTPFYAFLLLASACDWRRTWPWLAFLGVVVLLTFWPAAYVFGIKHLGLGVSRTVPLGSGLIPTSLCCAYALDRALTTGLRSKGLAIAFGALLLLPLPLLRELDPVHVTIGMILLASTAVLVWRPWSGLAL